MSQPRRCPKHRTYDVVASWQGECERETVRQAKHYYATSKDSAAENLKAFISMARPR